MNAITTNQGWRLRPDQTILVKGVFDNAAQRLKGSELAVRALAGS